MWKSYMIENFHKLHIDVGRDLVKLYVIYGDGVGSHVDHRKTKSAYHFANDNKKKSTVEFHFKPCLQRVLALTLLNRSRTDLDFDASVDDDTDVSCEWCN